MPRRTDRRYRRGSCDGDPAGGRCGIPRRGSAFDNRRDAVGIRRVKRCSGSADLGFGFSQSPAASSASVSWRGIAACLVALFHLEAYSHLVYSHLHGVPFLRNSWLFVDFFFVLSGFVIAANYQQRLLDGFGVGRFLLLRLGRLYPLHFAILAASGCCRLLLVLNPALASVTPGAPAPLHASHAQ